MGSHRNVVFPVEASLAADLSIGHLFGATAALEAAVAGCRAVLLNTGGLRTRHDDVYARALVVFPNLSEVLLAVRAEREGSVQGLRMGDWNAIIDYFDPFRDGRAAERLRTLIVQETPVSEVPGARFAT